MRAQPLPLIGGFYADETRPWAMQDICNWLPCAAEAEGTRTPTLAKTPPGLAPFVDTGEADPIRGTYNAEGRLFTVAGGTAYQISNTGVAIPLGSISGVSRARFAHNQITGGNEVLIVNGSAGWVWNTVTSQLTQITDPGYPGAIDAVFIDGYLVQIEPARRFAFHSELADALNYNTLDRFTSEVSPDLLVALAVSNNELILFSEHTSEFFENTGAAQQPFRSKRISFDKGCAGRYAVATIDNTVAWLGDDGVFYVLNDYAPRRISTRPIEQAIRGLNWSQAFAFVWEDSGHAVAYWTFPDGLTFGYDFSQQQWHRRASYGFDRWRVQSMAYWRNRWIAGDFQTGKLWELDWAYPFEGDQEFVSEITSPVIHDNQSRVLMPRLEIVMDTGMPEVEVREFPEQPAGPTIEGNADDGLLGFGYNYSYLITPGDASIASVAVVSGALPDGLSINLAGEISGTPSASGAFSFTIRATDANGLWAEVSDSIAITVAMWAAQNGNSLLLKGFASDDWTGATSNPGLSAASEQLVDSYGGKIHFMNSNGGRVCSDGAGVSWAACSGLPGGTIIKSMVYVPTSSTAGKWIAIPESGTLGYASTDGAAFSSFTLNGSSASWFGSIARGNIVLVGRTSNTVRRSVNGGTSWEDATAAFGGSSAVRRFADSGTAFICSSNTASDPLSRSTDGGATWSAITFPDQSGRTVRKLAYGLGVGDGGGRFLIVLDDGSTRYSDDDGVTFVEGASAGVAPSDSSEIDNNMVFSEGFFVMNGGGAGNSTIVTTPDGVGSFVTRLTTASTNEIYSITPFRLGQ